MDQGTQSSCPLCGAGLGEATIPSPQPGGGALPLHLAAEAGLALNHQPKGIYGYTLPRRLSHYTRRGGFTIGPARSCRLSRGGFTINPAEAAASPRTLPR